MSPPGLRRIVLVGFMGSGKSTVGRILADALDWTFVDVDALLEAKEGLDVAGIFARRGEAWFREAERAAVDDLLGREAVVIATGGGWAAAPGRLDGLPPGTAAVWLRVGAAEALRRVSTEAGRRPLLEVADPLGTVVRLLRERERRYASARVEVDTEGRSAEDVSSRILDALRDELPETHTGNP